MALSDSVNDDANFDSGNTKSGRLVRSEHMGFLIRIILPKLLWVEIRSVRNLSWAADMA